MGSLTAGREYVSRNDEQFSILFDGMVRCQKSAAALWGFDDHRAQRHATYDAVAPSKVLGVGPRSQRMFGHHRAVGRNMFGQRSMLSGVDNVPSTQNGHRSPSRLKGCSMGNAINPASESAYYRNTGHCKLGAQLMGDLSAIGGCPSRANHRHQAVVVRRQFAYYL